LHYAVEKGDIAIVQVLLDAKAPVDARDYDDEMQNKAPLHYAPERGHHAVVDKLLESSAVVNSSDRSRMTPLHHAALSDHIHVAQ